ncbi:CHAT domain-containing protein [Nonomuraea sp. M3C6]|uniref:CHAT domain-containing protein n=1 Tax=Nonomuraea marmarensis TaxID=3351344 RepID=A0ABW7ALD8_9ACTN
MSPGSAADLVRQARERLEASPDEAIRQFRDAVALLRKVKTGEDAVTKAEALVSLGKAYMARQAGVRADNVEQAIKWYDAALRFLYHRPFRGTADDHLISESERVRALLAIAYDERVLGSREENLSRILVHTDSVDLDDEEDTELRAMTRMLRGKAYRDRSDAQGLGVIDHDTALYFFRDALRQLDGREETRTWADVHLEIGKTLLRPAAGRDDTPWTDAAEHLQKALDGYARIGWAVGIAAVHEQLGNYCLRRDGTDFREKALDHYSLAVRHLSPDDNPTQWAQVQAAMARLALDGGSDAIDVALSHFASALDALTRSEHAAMRLTALIEPAFLQLDAGRWESAAASFEEALELALAGVNQAKTMTGRRAAVSDISDLAHGLAYSHYRRGNLDEAVIALESGRARLLAETLQWTDPDGAALTAAQRRQLARITRRIQELESAQYGGMSSVEGNDRLGVLRARRNTIVDRIQRSQRRHAAPKRPELSEIAPDEPGTALVVPLIGPVGSTIFILTAADRHVAPENVLELPENTAAEIDRWLGGGDTSPGWLHAYQHRNDGAMQQELWRTVMLDVCGDLWDTFAGRLWDRLRELGISRVTFVPTAGLQFLPLHAAAPRGPGPARSFMDDVTVTYAPSAYVLAVSKRRGTARTIRGPALLAGVTRYEELPPLPSVKDELDLIGAALGSSTILLDEQASRKQVLRQLAGASIVHLACHGAAWALGGAIFRMAWSPPPVLHLWNEGLSFQDILLQDLHKVRLVCLSACDTGMVDESLPWDEFEGLANVFLQAGAAAVVSSLWAVDDRSTALLMQRFYENLRQRDQDPAAALRAAQLWLRDSTRASLAAVYEQRIEEGHGQFVDAYSDLALGGDGDERPYAHPFYWAPFTLTGQ